MNQELLSLQTWSFYWFFILSWLKKHTFLQSTFLWKKGLEFSWLFTWCRYIDVVDSYYICAWTAGILYVHQLFRRNILRIIDSETFISLATHCMRINQKLCQDISFGINLPEHRTTWSSLPMHASCTLHSLKISLNKIPRQMPKILEKLLIFFRSLPRIPITNAIKH